MLNVPTSRRRGFSLIEVMVALAVLLVAGAGAMMALVAANQQMRDGQLRQLKMVLVEAKAQRMVLASKTSLTSAALAVQTVDPASVGVGTAPWSPDGTAMVAGDLGTGTVFEMRADGTIIPWATAPTNCATDAAVKTGQYCREVLVAKGLPPSAANTSITTAIATTQPYTRWIRVSRKGEPDYLAVIYREVFVP